MFIARVIEISAFVDYNKRLSLALGSGENLKTSLHSKTSISAFVNHNVTNL